MVGSGTRARRARMGAHAVGASGFAIAVVLAVTVASPVLAQDTSVAPAPAAAPAEPAAAADIVVTGSRLARAGFSAPTPVTVVGAARFEDLAATNVGEALSQLPAFQSFQSPTNSNLTIVGNIGARTLDLRQLGAQRTLVLVDGRRF
ncbi:MAG: TonB-dependent receptor-like protein, partial [Sphingomonas bacterium]|nr:TonB-dependent receptor-like protein [Sphingomonas bacterium]